MTGTILDVVNGGTVWLILVADGQRIAEHVIEPRQMRDIVEGEGFAGPYDLAGRAVRITDDGLHIEFV